MTEFRANAASMIEKIKTEHLPLVITQHGKSSMELLNVSDYEQMIDTIKLLQEINQARQEIEDGKRLDHEELMSSLSLKERLRKA